MGYQDKIATLGQSMIDASNGLLTQYDLEHGKMDITIEKLNTILRLKEQEARIADSELMQNVYKNRGDYQSYEDKLSSQKKEFEGNYSEADKYMGIYDQLGSLQSQIKDAQMSNQLNGVSRDTLNDFGLTDDQTKKFNDIIYKLGQGNSFLSVGMYNPRAIMDGLLGAGSPLLGQVLAEAQKYNVGATKGTEQYYQTQSEYGNLYNNELAMIQRNLEHRYGGTYEELSGKFFSGSDQDRDAFMKMVQSIQALSAMFPGLEEGYKFGGEKMIETLKPYMTGDVVQAFAGRSKVSGTDPMSMLYNHIVDLSAQGKSGIFEADKASVADISGKIAGRTSTKEENKSLQQTLSRYGYLEEGGVDGIVGPKTKAALKQFQDDVSSGKLTIDTLPESVTNATSSIDGLTSAASMFAQWVQSNIGGGVDPLPGGGVTGTRAGVGDGASGGKGNGVSGVAALNTAVDAVSSASSSMASSTATASDSVKTFGDASKGAANWVDFLENKLRNFNPVVQKGPMKEEKMANGGITSGPQHALVGEDGPEAIIPLSEKRRSRGMSLWKAAGAALGVRMYADGGIVGDAEDPASPRGGLTLDVGGIHITVEVHGGGDSASVVAAIKEKMPEVANEVAGQIARMLQKSYSNMPLTEGA